MGHSSSGYMNFELALEWLKWLDTQTRAKANGKMRVFYLDGHSTHTTLEFDDYTADHNIILVGYPPDYTSFGVNDLGSRWGQAPFSFIKNILLDLI